MLYIMRRNLEGVEVDTPATVGTAAALPEPLDGSMPLPDAPVELPQVRLKIARRSSHPWIFQKMVEKPATRLPGGSVVDVLDRDGNFAGRGFYNGHSRIALRILTADPSEVVDADFFARRIDQAVSLRRDWLGLEAVTD